MADKPEDVARRMAEAREVFERYPAAVPSELQRSVLAQQVAVGMDPYMARLAGGSYSFKVIADPGNWSPGTHPQQVMDAQSLRPDDSEIWLTFNNDTQYPGEGVVNFRVYISCGRVKSVEKLPVPNSEPEMLVRKR